MEWQQREKGINRVSLQSKLSTLLPSSWSFKIKTPSIEAVL